MLPLGVAPNRIDPLREASPLVIRGSLVVPAAEHEDFIQGG